MMDGTSPQPHRGTLILVLGIGSLVASLLFVCCWPGEVLAIGAGVTAAVLASGDQRKMAAGALDPTGLGATKAGKLCGIIGAVLGTLVLLGGLAFTVFVMSQGGDWQRPWMR